MSISAAEGSQIAVIGTEHVLATITVAGDYQLKVDMSNMALGDIVELRVKDKVRATGTSAEYVMKAFAHVQDPPVVASVPIDILNEGIFTLKQVAGIGRTFNWEISQVDA